MAVKVKAALQVSAAIQKPIVVASWRDPELLVKSLMVKQQVLSSSLINGLLRSAAMRHLLDTTEFNKSELEALIALGREMKANPAAFRTGLAGKNIVTCLRNSRCVPA